MVYLYYYIFVYASIFVETRELKMNNTNDDSNPILIFWASIHTVWFIFLILKLFGLLPDWTWPVILFPILAECVVIFGFACGIVVLSMHSRVNKK